MKKIIAVIMALILTSTLCACGNMSVEKWYENETGIEVKTKEVGALYLSEGTYFLISDDCPFCDRPTEKGGVE